MANIQRVHAEDSGDFRVALLQHELRQQSDTNFFRRHFERADGEIVEFCYADFFGPAAVKLCRDPRRFRRESMRWSNGQPAIRGYDAAGNVMAALWVVYCFKPDGSFDRV